MGDEVKENARVVFSTINNAANNAASERCLHKLYFFEVQLHSITFQVNILIRNKW